MKIAKKNLIFILKLMFFIILFSVEFPYYIDAPGGISNMQEKLEMYDYESKGSFNVAYVKEYRATIPTLFISFFNKEWNVIKQNEMLLENESNKDYEIRDKLFMKESVSNAIYVAFKKANSKINITESKSSIIYLDKNSVTDLKIGDTIISIDNILIKQKTDITKVIENYNVGDVLNVKVINNGKLYNRYVELIELDQIKKLGILLVTLNNYETIPEIKVNIDKNESGSSGGLIMALAIYNNLIKEDITKGYTIVGTGTIDINGNVGSIGGVEYKLKSAVSSKADIFLVPNGENYETAMRIKKEKNYKINVVGINNFDDALFYLDKLPNK